MENLSLTFNKGNYRLVDLNGFFSEAPKGFSQVDEGVYVTNSSFIALGYYPYGNTTARKEIRESIHRYINSLTKDFTHSDFIESRKGRDWDKYDALDDFGQLVYRLRELMYFKGVSRFPPNYKQYMQNPKKPIKLSVLPAHKEF